MKIVKKNIDFVKMHGLGNIFVIVDNRANSRDITSLVKFLSSDDGLCCDQFGILENSEQADVFMRIFNKDGGEVEACGNITRCVAGLIMDNEGGDFKTIETLSGILHTKRAGDNLISVDMGEPKLDWQDIPLAMEMDTLDMELSEYGLVSGVAVNVGNPHIVFFRDEQTFSYMDSKTKCYEAGESIEKNPLFPNRVNVDFAYVLDKNNIEIIVWERGAGITKACGTGACATLVAAVRKGLTNRKATVKQQGGGLIIEWNETNNRITMTGEYAYSLEGTITKIYSQ